MTKNLFRLTHYLLIYIYLSKMPKCFICKLVISSIKDLCHHFKYMHGNHSFDYYECAEERCNRKYFLINSFKKHLKIHTSISDDAEYLNAHQNVNNFNSDNLIQHNNCNEAISEFSDLSTAHDSGTAQTAIDFESSVLKFTANLHANTLIPRNVVQYVTENMNTLVSDSVIKPLQNMLSQCLSQRQISAEWAGRLQSHLDKFSDSFEDVRSEHVRFALFKEKGTYIEPEEYVLGQRLETSYANNSFKLVPTTSTGQFIPLRHVLKKFLESSNDYQQITQHYNDLKSSNCDVIQNIVQGSEWRKMVTSCSGQIVLPLGLYFDDYEVGNPLGSRAGVHKLGAVYISILCLPPHYLSKLQNIFLALLFHSFDRQHFGNRVTFGPIISELNFLSRQGIDLTFSDGTHSKVFFKLAVILGDNLGLHSLIGFTESFSSNFSCRICKIRKEDLRYAHECDRDLYRTMEQYLIDLNQRNVSETGIKEECVWHDIDGFSVINNVRVDIMHDLLEGVCKYDMSFILYYYIEQLKLFSLDTLNGRLTCFDYGPDRSNQPPCILQEHLRNQSIKMSASEMLCFVRYFSLLVEDLIPTNDTLWELYLHLRKILDIVISNQLQKGTIDFLKLLISEHHKLYLRITNKTLTPKFHFLTHYHDMLQKFGPLVSIWSMRFEAKHRLSKLSANVSSNRRNVCKSLAIRHQLKLNNLFLNKHLEKKVQMGHNRPVDDNIKEKIMNKLNLNSAFIEEYNWLIISGTRYNCNLVLTLDVVNDGMPIFGSINSIFLCNDDILFEVNLFETQYFDERLCCFVVIKSNAETEFFMYDKLYSYVPNTMTRSRDSRTTYVTLRSSI
ncbi:uncharacterized protein LOC133521619 [Cydia pomonella]|uniref:uncharacterized protein LOC133521619 n=1 Tax=Cydia pomonella TaxID=82600 RepID=UPI002ADD48D1|nr:uncharacterized protein LOC133521619 [Cydia pomonella]